MGFLSGGLFRLLASCTTSNHSHHCNVWRPSTAWSHWSSCHTSRTSSSPCPSNALWWTCDWIHTLACVIGYIRIYLTGSTWRQSPILILILIRNWTSCDYAIYDWGWLGLNRFESNKTHLSDLSDLSGFILLPVPHDASGRSHLMLILLVLWLLLLQLSSFLTFLSSYSCLLCSCFLRFLCILCHGWAPKTPKGWIVWIFVHDSHDSTWLKAESVWVCSMCSNHSNVSGCDWSYLIRHDPHDWRLLRPYPCASTAFTGERLLASLPKKNTM